ncbi:MAG: hypothetical protein Q8R82_09590 [Hyphomonadaceae bacterium]|nr:hypothetical protein [Hyphomonadaceae bacterium]
MIDELQPPGRAANSFGLTEPFKCMSLSLARLVPTQCLFPGPNALVQDILEKGVRQPMALLKERVFLHFQRTALVTDRLDEAERKYQRSVKKVGIDPHFSYANMLCDVAWSRAHGTATFILPAPDNLPDELRAQAERMDLHGVPPTILEKLIPLPTGEVCGRCVECPITQNEPPTRFFCNARQFITQAKDVGCPIFVPA